MIDIYGISFGIGGVVFVLCMALHVFITWKNPKEIKVKISRIVEELARSQGMSLPIAEQKELTNEFVEQVSLGGAGGQGNSKITAANAEEFLKTVKEAGGKWIYFAFETVNGKLLKKYWSATTEGVLVEYIEIFFTKEPNFSNYYIIKNDKEEVTYKKNMIETFFYGMLLSFAVAMIALIIALFATLVLDVLL